MREKCYRCKTEMETMKYICDDDYGITSCCVYNSKREKVGCLMYCPKCGDIKIKLLEVEE